MPNLWIPTGVMSKIDVEVLRPVKTEKLLGTSENTLVALGTLLLKAAMIPTDF